MTPPAAASAPRTRTRTTAPPPRRVSGPARGRSRATTVTAPPPLALRIGGAVHGLAEHHLLERIIRGRAWIAILGIGLIGIVFMQVSMLRMNAGIGASVERASALERENSAMRAAISELSSGERIAVEASKLGLILPQGTPRFLDARSADARRALASMTAPGVGIVASATQTPVEDPAVTATTPVLGDTGVAPAAETAVVAEEQTAPVAQEPAVAPVAQEPAADPAATPPATPDTTAQTTAATPATTGGVDATGQGG